MKDQTKDEFYSSIANYFLLKEIKKTISELNDLSYPVKMTYYKEMIEVKNVSSN